MISRPLWEIYIFTPEQKSSGILISELFEVRKWVVEKFHGISPGLVDSNAKFGILYYFCKWQNLKKNLTSDLLNVPSNFVDWASVSY